MCVEKAGEMGVGVGVGGWGIRTAESRCFGCVDRSLEKGVQWEGNEGLGIGGILVHGGWAVWDDVVDGYPGRANGTMMLRVAGFG